MTGTAGTDRQPDVTAGPATGRPTSDAAGSAAGNDAGNARFVPGQPDMWAFVLFELLVFTAYFAVYLFYRSDHADLILDSQGHLDLRFGTLNTVLLLTSSWSMARCVQAARAGAYRSALSGAYVTTALGAAFLVSKTAEWAHLAQDGFGFSTNEFFMYYFALTGIHCLHLLIGFVAMGVVIYQLRGATRRSQELVETCAVYWHTVDLLWVMIFSLLYVVR